MAPTRYTLLTMEGADAATVAHFVPDNYLLLAVRGDSVLIGGIEPAGWTSDDASRRPL